MEVDDSLPFIPKLDTEQNLDSAATACHLDIMLPYDIL
jgi:hypothetical protein